MTTIKTIASASAVLALTAGALVATSTPANASDMHVYCNANSSNTGFRVANSSNGPWKVVKVGDCVYGDWILVGITSNAHYKRGSKTYNLSPGSVSYASGIRIDNVVAHRR